MYGVQSSKSFLIEIIGSSKERKKISNDISDKTYEQGQIWLVRRQDFQKKSGQELEIDWYPLKYSPPPFFFLLKGCRNEHKNTKFPFCLTFEYQEN